MAALTWGSLQRQRHGSMTTCGIPQSVLARYSHRAARTTQWFQSDDCSALRCLRT